MGGQIVGGEGELAVGTLRSFVEFFLMFLHEIDVVHFAALAAFLDVAPAVAEVGGDLRLGEHLQAVLAPFHRLGHLTRTSSST